MRAILAWRIQHGCTKQTNVRHLLRCAVHTQQGRGEVLREVAEGMRIEELPGHLFKLELAER